jgi:hypothetical protein
MPLAAAPETVSDSSNRIHQHHIEAGIEKSDCRQVVMQQSRFVVETAGVPEANLVGGATACHTSPLVAYALPAPRCSWPSLHSR